jgi:hypothetical protein
VRAEVRSSFYDGALEVVSATIPGETDQEVIVVAHLCHPLPSANDNASGAAAALEAALTVQKLVATGELNAPTRTIRFLWLPEMTGSVAYLSANEDSLSRLVAGLNLDMVGEDQDQTGSVWLIERPPDASASFAPDLLARLRDEMPELKGMSDISPSHTGLGGYRLYRQDESPFSGGSDHYIFSDPTVGVPMPMLIQWPDRYYHTSADTPDRTSPRSLARSGALAAMYAYWIACADVEAATWLGHEMVARFKQDLVATAQDAVTRCLDTDSAEDLAKAILRLDRRVAYRLDRHKVALESLGRLAAIDCLVADLHDQVREASRREFAWARGIIHLQAAAQGLTSLPILPNRSLTGPEQRAAALAPRRLVRGPVPVQEYLRQLPEEERESFRQTVQAKGERIFYTLSSLALYWADGERTVGEIADAIENESGQRDVEILLAFYELLGRFNLIALEHTGQ